MSAVTIIISHAVVVGVVALDQFCKSIVNSEVGINFLGVISIRQIWNQGISFGMFEKLEYGNNLFLVISSVVLAHLHPFSLKIRDYSALVAWSLILGGAFSNVIDRVLHGAVLDFIDIHFGKYSFPIFNIADLAIAFGALILIWNAMLNIKKGR
jgi:signal peptidase II